jgi:hypothetical protein
MLDLMFTGHGAWFAVPAVLGTGLFLLRVGMMLLGLGTHDLHFDVGHAGGMGDLAHAGGHGGDVHTDTGHAFTVLSLQSIAAFLMGFGWGGVAAMQGQGWTPATSTLVAVLCGVAMVWLLTLLLKGAADLQSSGTIPISAALGVEGDVYLTVPPRGRGLGQVRVVVRDRQRIYNAVAESGTDIPSQSRVRVTAVNPDNTLTVAPV